MAQVLTAIFDIAWLLGVFGCLAYIAIAGSRAFKRLDDFFSTVTHANENAVKTLSDTAETIRDLREFLDTEPTQPRIPVVKTLTDNQVVSQVVIPPGATVTTTVSPLPKPTEQVIPNDSEPSP